MNDKFSFSRFANVFRFFLRDSITRYGKALLVMIGVLCGIVIFFIYFSTHVGEYIHYDPTVEIERGLFGMSILLFATISASLLMNPLGTKPSATQLLMLPATNLEKYLARWIIFVPLAMAVFLAGCICIDVVRLAIEQTMQRSYITTSIFNCRDWNAEFVEVYIGAVLYWSSFFALGSLVWAKNSWVKTALAALALMIAFSIFISICFNLLLNPQMHYDADPEFIESPNFIFTYTCIAATFNYVLAYFRFKESEIIERW